MKAKFFLPNSLTAMNLIIAIFAIVTVLDDSSMASFVYASWLVCLAGIFDGLDGKVARLTNAQSEFGVEFDSIADFAAFVLAPGFIGYSLMSKSHFDEKIILFSIVVYILGGAIRLARFNVVQGGEKEKGLFQGLPTPAGAGNVISMILFYYYFFGANLDVSFLTSLLFVNFIITGVLMVSNVKYDNIFSMFKTSNPKFLVYKKISVQLVFFILLLVYMIVDEKIGYFFPVLLTFYHLRAIASNIYSVSHKEA